MRVARLAVVVLVSWLGAITAPRPAAAREAPAPVVLEDSQLFDPLVFDARFYLRTNPDLGAAGLTTADQARAHWKTWGLAEGRQASPIFAVREYLAQYGDLRAAFGDDHAAALRHFLVYGKNENRDGLVVADHPNPLAITNPNLEDYDPTNALLGPLMADFTQGPSTFNLNQWATPDYVEPGVPGQVVAETDPVLGEAVLAQATPSKRLAIYRDSGGHWAFELAAAGGTERSSGGSNIFLATSFPTGVDLSADASFELDWNLVWDSVHKTAPFDGVNVGQTFVGLIFGNATSHETLFLQKIISEANGSTRDSHVDTGTNAPLFSNTLAADGSLATAPGWHHSRFYVVDDLRAALATTYTKAGSADVTFADQDWTHWKLTAVYMGPETAGSSAVTIQVKQLCLAP